MSYPSNELLKVHIEYLSQQLEEVLRDQSMRRKDTVYRNDSSGIITI